MDQSKITVWGTGTSRTLRVFWTLHELGVDYDYRVIRARTSDMDDLSFLAISPGKKIPALTHGELKLVESGAITRYLFNKFGDRSIPTEEMAIIDRWVFFILMELDATALYVMRRHGDLPDIYGAAPAALRAAESYFDRQITIINEVLSHNSLFLVGNQLSEADIHLGTCCSWAAQYGLVLPSRVAIYYEEICQRTEYAEAVVVNSSAAAQ